MIRLHILIVTNVLLWLFFGSASFLFAQQLGLYVSPYDTVSSEIAIEKTGFDAILIKADLSNISSVESLKLRLFAYPWIPNLNRLDETEIETKFINDASTTFRKFELTSFHPANLIRAQKPLDFSFDKYYNERIISYIKAAESVPANKKAWLLMSFLDYPYATEQIKANPNLDVEAIVFKAYKIEDYQIKKLQRIIDLAADLNIKWVFIDNSFLSEAITLNPSLAIYLRSIQNNQPLNISRLAYRRSVDYNQFGSILIVIFVSLFVLHFSISVRYQRSLQRYFTNSRFFLQDIKSWRNAIGFSAFMVMLKFIGLHALVQTALLSIVISPDGFSLLNERIGLFSLSSLSPLMSAFLNVLMINFILHALIVVWAKLINNGLRFLGQITSVYAYGMHLQFLLLIPTYLSIESLPQSFWFISLAALGIMLLVPINHLRAQINLATIDTNGVLWTIGLGYVVFWTLISAALFFTQLQFNWIETFKIAVAIP